MSEDRTPSKANVSMTDELTAMQKVADAIALLDPAAVRRVFTWVSDRLELGPETTGPRPAFRPSNPMNLNARSTQDFSAYPDAASFLSAAKCATDAERLLTAAYWYQYIKQEADLNAQTLNTELKNIGHKLTNVTRTFSELIDRKPALAMQVSKTGSGAQGRKRYRLTLEGKSYLEGIFGREDRGDAAG